MYVAVQSEARETQAIPAEHPGLSGVWDRILSGVGVINRNVHEDAVYKVYQRVDYNECPTFLRWILPGECVDYESVFTILNVYVGLVEECSISNYHPQEPDAKSIIEKVALVSGYSPEFTKKVLDELYWGTYDGTIKSFDTLYPPSSESCALRKVPKNVDSIRNEIGSFFDTAWDIIFWLLLLGVIGIAGYFAWPFIAKKVAGR